MNRRLQSNYWEKDFNEICQDDDMLGIAVVMDKVSEIDTTLKRQGK